MQSVGVAIIGAGKVALGNHLPGLGLDGRAEVVALCDANPQALECAGRETGVRRLSSDYRQTIAEHSVDAVIVATPNFTHREIVLAAVAAKKHVMCEKPLALNYRDAREMYEAAEAARVRHMTAFTYRFVPAMRYAKNLVDSGAIGQPYHFRAQRFQDWGTRGLGWRQNVELAGSGELADMLSHRIDYAHHLIGPIARVVAEMKNFVPQREGQPSDVDDWVAMLCEFANRETTGVLESTKLATGRGEGHRGQDIVEINGSEGTIVYSTQKPLHVQIGKRGDADLHEIEIPESFAVWPGSPRDPTQGDPLATFRYDQSYEFIDAIVNNRPCRPSFFDGMRAQAVMDAAIESHRERKWVEVTE